VLICRNPPAVRLMPGDGSAARSFLPITAAVGMSCRVRSGEAERVPAIATVWVL